MIGDGVFSGALILGAVAWGIAVFVSLFEDLVTQLFVPWVFRLGPRALHRPCTLRPPAWPCAGSSTIELQYGVARIVSPTECLFRQPFASMSSRFYDRGIRPRGVIRWQGAHASVECRLSVTSVLLWGGWLAISAGAGGNIVLAGSHRFGGVLVLLFGWGIAIAGYKSSSRKAREWAEEILAELSDVLPQAA